MSGSGSATEVVDEEARVAIALGCPRATGPEVTRPQSRHVRLHTLPLVPLQVTR